MKTPREHIESITLIQGNIQHIIEAGKINGSLLMDLEKAFKEYATECCKASLEKAAESGGLTIIIKEGKPLQTNKLCLRDNKMDVSLDKQSITNPENITLL